LVFVLRDRKGSLMIHRLMHFIGWNTGTVETWWENKRLYVGFKCTTCGKVSGVEDITDNMRRSFKP